MDMDSFKYLNMFLKSDKLISSTCDLWIYNPLGRDQKYLRDLLNFDFIFLRSGIIKDDLSKSINWLSTKIDLFITSTKEEYTLNQFIFLLFIQKFHLLYFKMQFSFI